jgi:hypothetical protein
MAYKSGADGVTQSGKTKGKNLGDDGKKIGTQSGGKGSKGVSSDSMKSVGRNLARVANQG